MSLENNDTGESNFYFRWKIDDNHYQYKFIINQDLVKFHIKLIKAIGLAATIIGIGILIALWIWIIRWLYQVW